jgi:hypothetical protein
MLKFSNHMKTCRYDFYKLLPPSQKNVKSRFTRSQRILNLTQFIEDILSTFRSLVKFIIKIYHMINLIILHHNRQYFYIRI